MVFTQQRLNFLHVRFREIGVFLRGNGSRNTGGFTRAATRGHNTEGCLCLVTAGNAAAGCKQVFDVLRHQASIGNGVVRALFEVIMARAGALRVVDAVLEDRTITHVIVNNKNGLAAYKAKCFIDCTGDADLIKLVGASYQSGNHNRVNQPVSLRFDMAGIDFERFHAYMRSLGNDQYKYFAMNTPGMKDIIRKAYENGVLTEQDACYFQAFGIPGRPDGMNFNCPELTTKENVVDAEFMTQKQLEGKKAIMRLRKFLRDYIPGFENAYITSIAQLVGFRESRRIEAEYMLTIEDVLTYRKFPDGIAASHYPIDVHGVDDVSLGLKYQHDVPVDEQYWEVPFRVMIPKTLDNVLTAGRCAGMDFRAQSAARIQPTCRSMGEAAGIAAAMAVKNEAVRFNEIDGTAVRREIRLPDKF